MDRLIPAPQLSLCIKFRQCSEFPVPPLSNGDKMSSSTSPQGGTGIRHAWVNCGSFECKQLARNMNLLSGKRRDSLVLGISLNTGVVQRFKGKAVVSPFFFISCGSFTLSFNRQTFHLLHVAATCPTNLSGKEAFSYQVHRPIPRKGSDSPCLGNVLAPCTNHCHQRDWTLWLVRSGPWDHFYEQGKQNLFLEGELESFLGR